MSGLRRAGSLLPTTAAMSYRRQLLRSRQVITSTRASLSTVSVAPRLQEKTDATKSNCLAQSEGSSSIDVLGVGSSTNIRPRLPSKIVAGTALSVPSLRQASTLASSASTGNMYTASFAFFEAVWEAGITHCFVNLGSDHPSIIEAMVKGQREAKGRFPRIITCPNEVCIFRALLAPEIGSGASC